MLRGDYFSCTHPSSFRGATKPRWPKSFALGAVKSPRPRARARHSGMVVANRACLWLCEAIKENNRWAGLKAPVRPHLDLDLDPEPFVCLARWRLC